MQTTSKFSIPETLANFDLLPDSAYVAMPIVMGLYGVSAATVWRQSGKTIPKPHKLWEGTTRWNVGELRKSHAQKKGGQS